MHKIVSYFKDYFCAIFLEENTDKVSRYNLYKLGVKINFLKLYDNCRPDFEDMYFNKNRCMFYQGTFDKVRRFKNIVILIKMN